MSAGSLRRLRAASAVAHGSALRARATYTSEGRSGGRSGGNWSPLRCNSTAPRYHRAFGFLPPWGFGVHPASPARADRATRVRSGGAALPRLARAAVGAIQQAFSKLLAGSRRRRVCAGLQSEWSRIVLLRSCDGCTVGRALESDRPTARGLFSGAGCLCGEGTDRLCGKTWAYEVWHAASCGAFRPICLARCPRGRLGDRQDPRASARTQRKMFGPNSAQGKGPLLRPCSRGNPPSGVEWVANRLDWFGLPVDGF